MNYLRPKDLLKVKKRFFKKMKVVILAGGLGPEYQSIPKLFQNL